VEAERRAAVEAPAKADKARVLVEAEAEAEKRRIEAQGQASAIFAALDAQARGEYEMLAKKAEGLRQLVDACGGAQQAFQLLMLEHLDKLAETSAKAISNIKFDKVVVWEGGQQNGQTSVANFLQGVSRTMPPMMQVLRDVAGIELPETLVRMQPDMTSPPPSEENGSPTPASAATTPPAAPPADAQRRSAK
jgi:flotillin